MATRTTAVTKKQAHALAYRALNEGIRLAKARGDAEQLANIALTCIELAARVEGKTEEKSMVGFAHHDDED